jgi:hypothetical protein
VCCQNLCRGPQLGWRSDPSTQGKCMVSSLTHVFSQIHQVSKLLPRRYVAGDFLGTTQLNRQNAPGDTLQAHQSVKSHQCILPCSRMSLACLRHARWPCCSKFLRSQARSVGVRVAVPEAYTQLQVPATGHIVNVLFAAKQHRSVSCQENYFSFKAAAFRDATNPQLMLLL